MGNRRLSDRCGHIAAARACPEKIPGPKNLGELSKGFTKPVSAEAGTVPTDFLTAAASPSLSAGEDIGVVPLQWGQRACALLALVLARSLRPHRRSRLTGP